MKQAYFLIGILVFAMLILLPTQVVSQTTCAAPTGLSTTNISQTGAYLYLTPTSTNAGTFNIQYHAGNTTTWTTVTHVTLPYALGNLTCGTTYEWQAQLVCPNTPAGTIAVSPWSVGGTFTTLACTPPPTCNAPTGLSATNISQTGAELHWNDVSGALSYIVYYKKANSASLAFTTVTSITNSIIINGLSGGTAYVWEVQAICSNSTSSTPASSVMSTAAVFLTSGPIIFPNPSNQLLNVVYYVESTTTTQIELRNNIGQLVYTMQKQNEIGSNDFTIVTSELSDGLYFLTVESNGTNTISKVLVKH